MNKKLNLLLVFILCAVLGMAQNGKVIKDTGGGGGANIYNTSDTLTSDREVGMNGKKLVFKTDSVPSAQSGAEFRPGLYNELANHFPLIIAASPNGEVADSIWFVSFDSNLSIATNTNGIKYAQANTFTNPLHIIDKAYCDANVAGSTGAGKGGIYEGDGTLPENVRASGGPSQRILSFDSIGYLEIKDWNTGQALRVWQDINSAAGKGFGRLFTASVTDDSLDISHTDGLVFDISATKPINIYSSEFKYFGNSFNLDLSSSGQVSDLRATKTGLQYAADYSANYTTRSLVDKAYCDGNAGAETNYIVLFDDTGLQNIGNTWEVITTLAQNTEIGTRFSWNGTTDQVTYSGTSGHVEIWFELSWETSTTFDNLTWSIRKNSVETLAASITEAAGTGELMQASGRTIISVANNDVFDFGAYFTTSSGTNVTFEKLVVGIKFIGE